MKTQRERNQEYYQQHREELKVRKLAYYHDVAKEKIDREKKKEYMREYLKTYKRKPKTPEEIAERNRRRRERYATDPEYREKVKSQSRLRNQRNPRAKKNGRLKAEFGITIEQYNAMLERQGGVCAICGEPMKKIGEKGKRNHSMYVDHDHKTGKVRGLLCNQCNFGLGQFRDDPILLAKAIEYLNNWSSGVA